MGDTREQSREILAFIEMNVREHPRDISSITSKEFGVTRQAVLRHIRKLIEAGRLAVHGKTRDRYYELVPFAEKSFEFSLAAGLEEDRIWRESLLPYLKSVTGNAREICEYGFTEMVNNAIDHSSGQTLSISLKYTIDLIDLWIIDDGVGIFQKIRESLHLEDNLHAILELSKGKLTTDPERHTGEGIFFTLRAFDRFAIASGNLYFSHTEESGDWLVEEREEIVKGTAVHLQISPQSTRKLYAVFDQYASGEDFGFSRTQVPVALARCGDEILVSRSQARRLLARFDRFREILLDFEGVDRIGQAFADEIFRVFQNQHPDIHLEPVRANEEVLHMIARAKAYPRS